MALNRKGRANQESTIEVPKLLYPLEALGVSFNHESGGNLVGECPFCGKDGKFYVNPETGQWDCKAGSCHRSGNVPSFLEQYYKQSTENISVREWRRLAENRGLPTQAWKTLNLGYDGSHWIIPCRDARGKLVDLRRYKIGGRTQSLKGLKTGLIGGELLGIKERRSEPVYFCEGDWDVGAMRWLINRCRRQGIVVGTPGANVFKPEWVEWLSGRDVIYFYDADNAGDDGSLKAFRLTHTVTKRNRFVHWPESLPPGFDVRDYVIKEAQLKKRSAAGILKRLTKLSQPTPRRYDPAVQTDIRVKRPPEKVKALAAAGVRLDPETGRQIFDHVPDFPELLAEYKKWLHMPTKNVDALKILLAVVLSNQIPGDPLWLYLVAPPGGSKTELLLTLAEADDVLMRSSLTPHSLVSGFKMMAGGEDPSLIPQLHGKVFVIKDYTEIMSMHIAAQEEIYGILRGAYDGRVEKSFGNGVYREYEAHFSIIAGVTPVIHGNTRATLGERFLKFQLFDGVGFSAERQILAALENISHESEMRSKLAISTAAFLSQKVPDVLPYVPDWFKARIVAMAQLIAMLRAQVDRDVRDNIKSRPQHEVGTRLAKQLVKLGLGLAIVEGKKQLDEDIYDLIETVAFDTARGFSLDVFNCLLKLQVNHERIDKEFKGISSKELAETANIPMTTLQRKIEDLLLLGVIDRLVSIPDTGRGRLYLYRATPRIKELWKTAEIARVRNPCHTIPKEEIAVGGERSQCRVEGKHKHKPIVVAKRKKPKSGGVVVRRKKRS